MDATTKLPFEPFEQDDAFRRLKRLMTGPHKPLALVGSGVSVPSGYPSWPGLLKALAKRLEERDGVPPKLARELDKIEDAPWQAQVYEQLLGPSELTAYIKQCFASQGSLSEPHLAIASLPFRHYLTTNYDPSIEEALQRNNRRAKVLDWTKGHAVSQFLLELARPQAALRVVYLHGRHDWPNRIVLTEASYVERYIKSQDARQRLIALFMTHPVVFIGFSMNDPDLANLMREVTARLVVRKASHFALMGYGTDEEKELIRQRMRGKFGIDVVFYHRGETEAGDRHANLLTLLGALGAHVSKEALAANPTKLNPDDPNKGQFGGSPTSRSRQLVARRKRVMPKRKWLTLELAVEPTEGATPITEPVEFHLHPTFDSVVRRIQPERGRATMEFTAYGAFTVGAIVDNGRTRLELDLAHDQALPEWFRRR